MSKPEAVWARCAAALLALAACAPLAAQTLSLLGDAPLRAERSPDAATVRPLSAGQRVELRQLSGGWAQVQAGAASGWVRASQLDLAGPDVGAASQLETGRRAAGATAVTLGVRALPPRGTRHALLVGIAQYAADPARPVPALAGVPHDMASALTMTALMQVPPDNITLLRDGAATRDGVQRALQDLAARVQPGDRVFLYWSGHGSRYFDAQADGCVETLVPHDLRDVSNRTFAEWLQPLAAKADKMLVVYDACHSGGVGGASSRGWADGWTPKFTAGPQACQQPSNLRTRSLDNAVRAAGASLQDVVHLSSSRNDEVSFDNPRTGGLATSSLLACFKGEARDLDGSGAISIDELAACAQGRIERQLRGQTQIDPQHLVLSGNRGFVPAWFASAPTASPAEPAMSPPAPSLPTVAVAPALPSPPTGPAVTVTPAVPSTPPPAPAPPAPATTTQPPPTAMPPVQSLLAQLHAQRDSKRRVQVTATADRLRIGRDTLDFSVTSSHDGYVHVAMLGSDQQSLLLLFPNALDGRNRIAAGETMLLPRAGWRLTAGGPAGRDNLLVMVTDGPRDLSALGGGRAGPFAKPLTDSQGRSRLQWLLGTNPRGGPAACEAGGCSDAFGSALFTVEEF